MLPETHTPEDAALLDRQTVKSALLTCYDVLTTEQRNKVITDGDIARVTVHEIVLAALNNDPVHVQYYPSPAQALCNMVENMKKGAFRVTILDDGKERDVTAETIENLTRVIDNA